MTISKRIVRFGQRGRYGAQHRFGTNFLFRIGIFADLLIAPLEIFVVLALYRLLNGVDRTLATLMVIFGFADVPVYVLNTLNDVGALLFARGADFLSAFGRPQRDAMVTLFLNLHHYGVIITRSFGDCGCCRLACSSTSQVFFRVFSASGSF